MAANAAGSQAGIQFGPFRLHARKRLLERDKIFTVGYDQAGVHGVRVTPHVFTQPKELDRLVAAIGRYAKLA